MARIKRPQPVATMDPFQVIRSPRVSEKSHERVQTQNTYTLEVDPRSTKTDIKSAVERIWNVNVLAVRTQNVAGKARRVGRRTRVLADWKKAMVRLAEGQAIDLMR